MDQKGIQDLFRLACKTLFLTGSMIVPNLASADVTNDKNIFENSTVCEGYHSFLAEEPSATTEGCNSIAKFLISNNHLSLGNYLRRALEFTGHESAFGAMVEVQLSARAGDTIRAFSATESAGRRMSIAMSQSGDIERAALYSGLLGEIQRLTVLSLCMKDAECDTIAPVSSIRAILGKDYSELDHIRPDIVLLCLLRTDGYWVPIRQLLQSRKFNSCLNNPY